MTTSLSPQIAHPQGEVQTGVNRDLELADEGPMVVDTPGGRYQVEWNESAPMTPSGQLVFFALVERKVISQGRLSWSFEEEKIAAEALFDGCHIIHSEVVGVEFKIITTPQADQQDQQEILDEPGVKL